jgi:glycosyltransferase involved in cell wall biosynthesis
MNANWLATMAASPAQVRPKRGKAQYRFAPEGDEAIRRRRATANRVLTMLNLVRSSHPYSARSQTHAPGTRITRGCCCGAESKGLDCLRGLPPNLGHDTMRIAQIAPLAESVPPKLYGGTERVVAWLVDELVSLGHEVTLFASGDSRTRAKLHPVWPQALRLGRPRTDPAAACAALLEAVGQYADKFDVIHAHIDWMHLPLLRRLNVPFLTTMHGRLDFPGLPELIRAFRSAPFVSISNNQRRPLGEANWLGTIYHGLPADLFQPSYGRGGYLAFLGRLTADKGPEAAIRIARAAGMPLRIAAKLPRAERQYFKQRLEPQIDGRQIRLVGEVNDEAKQRFLADAAALLFPIDWPEPFGLVMIEAMACGTPVIAFRSGSVPEVIDEGITGFIAETEADAVQAIQRLDKLSRYEVRAQFERRFTAKRMAQGYVAHYRALVDARPPNRTLARGRPGDPQPADDLRLSDLRPQPIC